MEITGTNAMRMNISAIPRRNHEAGSVRVIFEESRRARVSCAARHGRNGAVSLCHFSDNGKFPHRRKIRLSSRALSPKSRGILNSRRGSLVRITRSCRMACFSILVAGRHDNQRIHSPAKRGPHRSLPKTN